MLDFATFSQIAVCACVCVFRFTGKIINSWVFLKHFLFCFCSAFNCLINQRKPILLFSLLRHVWLFETPWTVACPAPLSHEIFQTRILEWVAISFSRGSSQPRDWTCISCIGRWILYHWATREALLHVCTHDKSLQSCLTLCNPTDCSLSAASAHGDSPSKNTWVGCHACLMYV